jgi:hypothetical protein
MKTHHLWTSRYMQAMYSGLYGMALGCSLALGGYQETPYLLLAVLCIGGALAVSLLAWAVDRRTQQLLVAPPVFVAATGVSAMIGAAALLGVPGRNLLIYAGGGGLLGVVLGLVLDPENRLGMLVIVLSALLIETFALMRVWNSPPMSFDELGVVTLSTPVVVFLLSPGMPHKRWLRAACSSALLCLFALVWSIPLLWRIQNPMSLAVPLGLAIGAVVTASLVLALVYLVNRRGILDSTWWHRRALEERTAPSLRQLVQAFALRLARRLSWLLGQDAEEWRLHLLKATIPLGSADNLWQLVQHTELQLGREMLYLITDDVAQTHAQLSPVLLDVIHRGAAHSAEAVWQPCLRYLIQHEPTAALRACGMHIRDGNLPAITEFMRGVRLNAQQRDHRILQCLIENASQLENKGVFAALLLLVRCVSPAMAGTLSPAIAKRSLPTVVGLMTDDDYIVREIIAQALMLAGRSIQEPLARVLRDRYPSMPASTAQQIAAGEADLLDWLYPPDVRPAEATEDVFHLEDMVNEPDDLITASHITTWFYQRPGVVRVLLQQAMGQSAVNLTPNPMTTVVSDVVIAGHANAAICKEVSSKVLNAVLEIDEANIVRVLVVTGAGLIRVTNDVRKPPSRAENRRPRLRKKSLDVDTKTLTPPLLALQNDLHTVEYMTGLAQVNSVRGQSGKAASYDNAVGAIRTRIQQAMRPNHSYPVLLHPAGHTLGASGVVLPFYELREPDLAPLQFTVPRSLLGPQFADLIDVHSRELREGMIEDARRRLAIYEEWKEMDVRQLQVLLYQMMEMAVGGKTVALTEAYFDVLMNDEPINFPVVLSRQRIKARDFSNLDIVQQRTQRLIEFMHNHSVRLFSPSVLQAIQEPKYPVTGTRNYDDPYVQSTDGTIAYVSLQDLVEWHLPGMIGHDEDWVERMDDFLRKFDPQDPDYEGERLDAINIAVFLDSFLRGWPPVFLQEEDVQKRYKQWARQQRAVVWHDVHARLRERQISMLPLRSDSVLFDVEDRGEAFVVTPHYLTDTQTLATYLVPEMGIPYYINHWQHRERIVAVPGAGKHNREMAQEVYRQATQGLRGGQFEAALEGFKQALRIHPTWTAERLFLDSWVALNPHTDVLLEHRLELIEAIDLFDKNMDAAVPKLEVFNKRYPLFLAEPYVLLAYYEAARNTRIRDIQSQIANLRQRADDLLDQLVKDRVIVLNEETGDYQLNVHEEEAKRFARKRSLKEVADRPEIVLERAEQYVADSLVSFGTDIYAQPSILQVAAAVFVQTVLGISQRDFSYENPKLWSRLNRASTSAELCAIVKAETQRQLRRLSREQPTRLEQREAFLEQVQGLEQERDKLNHQIWAALQRQANASLRQAMMLDRAYVNQVLRQHNHLRLNSNIYKKHIAPLHTLQRARKCLRLERAITKRLYRKQKQEPAHYAQIKDADNDQALLVVKEVARILEEIKQESDLEARDLDRLDNAIQRLDDYKKLDTLSKRHIQALIDRLRGHYLRETCRGYQMACKVLEINETRQQYSLCSRRQGQYCTALEAFRGNDQAPPISSFPGATFKVLDPDLTALPPGARIQLNVKHHTIDVVSGGKDPRPIVSCRGLGDKAQVHLANELDQDSYVNRLKRTGLSPAYGVLLTPVARVPGANAWYRLLVSLDPWLIRVMAYAGLSPEAIDPEYREEALSAFDHTSIVEKVTVEQEETERHALARFSNTYDTA